MAWRTCFRIWLFIVLIGAERVADVGGSCFRAFLWVHFAVEDSLQVCGLGQQEEAR